VCHLRHGDRVRSFAHFGDRPSGGSSLPNNDSGAVKKGKLSLLWGKVFN